MRCNRAIGKDNFMGCASFYRGRCAQSSGGDPLREEEDSAAILIRKKNAGYLPW